MHFFLFLNVFQASAVTQATKLNDIERGITPNMENMPYMAPCPNNIDLHQVFHYYTCA